MALVDPQYLFPLTATILTVGGSFLGLLGFLNVARKDGRDDLQRRNTLLLADVERLQKRVDYLTEQNDYLSGRLERLLQRRKE